MPDPLLDRQGVADHLGLALATIDRYRADGRLPEPDVMLGRSPGWHVSTIEAWQASRPGAGARTDLKRQVTVAEMGGMFEGGPDSVEWLREQRR